MSCKAQLFGATSAKRDPIGILLTSPLCDQLLLLMSPQKQ